MKQLNACKFYFVVLLSILHITSAKAQYDRPNNYVAMPQNFSPAATGLTNGSIRANAIREWWWVSVMPKALTNTYVSVDMPLLRKKLSKGNAIGVGVLLSESNYPVSSWIYNGINTIKTYGLSAAYHKAIDKEKKHHLSLGVQYLSSSSIISDQPYILSRSSSNSTNVGILYSGIVSEKLFLYGGISFKQNSISIRSVNEGMLETSFGGKVEITNRVAVFGNFTQVFIAGFYRTQGIAYSRITLNRNTLKTNNRWAVFGGLGYSVDDEIIPYMAIEYAGLRVGINSSNTFWLYNNNTFGTILSAQYVRQLPKLKKTTTKNNWNVEDMF